MEEMSQNWGKNYPYIYLLCIQKKILSEGVEPTTLGLLDPRSDQLSYESEEDEGGGEPRTRGAAATRRRTYPSLILVIVNNRQWSGFIKAGSLRIDR